MKPSNNAEFRLIRANLTGHAISATSVGHCSSSVESRAIWASDAVKLADAAMVELAKEPEER